MLYRPVTGNTDPVGLLEAVTRGLAPDGALYLPQSLPTIPRAFFNNISAMSIKEIGYVAANMLFGSDIPAEKIKEIIDSTISFDIPFIETEPNRFTLDLTKGPTQNYNDIGARFMANLVDAYRKSPKLNVIVVTSENVGNAVADAFSVMNGVTTYVVFPASGVSPLRRSQLLNYPAGVIPVEIAASFQECQSLVRDLITDEDIQQSAPLLTANSVNIAILFPRVIYFFYAYARLAALGKPLDKVVIATPTENLGNVTAAVIASKMGLPVSRFIAILNNDLDAADIVNESRLIDLLADEKGEIDITEPDSHPLRPDEVAITFKTDDPDAVSTAHNDHLRRNHKQRSHIIHFGPSLAALKNLIMGNNANRF